MAVELRGRFNLFPIARLRSIAEVETAGFRAGQVLLVADNLQLRAPVCSSKPRFETTPHSTYDFECFASTGVNTPETVSPNWGGPSRSGFSASIRPVWYANILSGPGNQWIAST